MTWLCLGDTMDFDVPLEHMKIQCTVTSQATPTSGKGWKYCAVYIPGSPIIRMKGKYISESGLRTFPSSSITLKIVVLHEKYFPLSRGMLENSLRGMVIVELRQSSLPFSQ